MSSIAFIMEREGEDHVLFACRGAGRGCTRNDHRTHKKHCEDCVRANPDETLAELQERLVRGDA